MRADIDAAGWLVEDQQSRPGRQPACQQHLLLIAARQQTDRPLRIGGTDVQQRDEVPRDFILLSPGERLHPATPRLQGKHDVLAHRQLGNDALRLALFRAIAESKGNGISRRADASLLAGDLHRTGVGAFNAEYHPRGLGSTGTEQTGERHHLSAPQRQIERRQIAPLAEMLEQRVWRLGLVDRLMLPVGGHF